MRGREGGEVRGRGGGGRGSYTFMSGVTMYEIVVHVFRPNIFERFRKILIRAIAHLKESRIYSTNFSS